jgi:uncharacterized protein (DUF305 family)
VHRADLIGSPARHRPRGPPFRPFVVRTAGPAGTTPRGDDMSTHTTRTTTRRGALRLAAAVAGVGIAAVGGTALAQQAPGMPGMHGTDGMPGGMMSGAPGTGGQPGGMMGGQPGGMMGGMPGMMQGMHAMMAMMEGLMGPDSDRLFIQEMIPHHQGAVEMATVAWPQAEHPEVKQLAEAIVKAQNEEVEQMARWYRAWFNAPVPPGQMMAMMAQMGMTPEALKGARPADKAFLEMMSMHHHMAVMMASMALPAAQHDELARLQQAIITDQAKEIAQMRSWRRAWYPG